MNRSDCLTRALLHGYFAEELSKKTNNDEYNEKEKEREENSPLANKDKKEK